MSRDRTKVLTLSTELNSYTASFTARGYTLAGELWSDGTYALTVVKTSGSALVAVGHGLTVKEAANDAAARVGIPGSPLFP